MSSASKIAVFMLVLLVAACTSSQPPTARVNVPDKLRAGANESLAMIVPARGVQIYQCRASKNQVGFYEWTFVAPEADLFDTRGNSRPTLCRSALGIDRWQQDLGYG
jgi:hypothetical protein